MDGIQTLAPQVCARIVVLVNVPLVSLCIVHRWWLTARACATLAPSAHSGIFLWVWTLRRLSSRFCEGWNSPQHKTPSNSIFFNFSHNFQQGTDLPDTGGWPPFLKTLHLNDDPPLINTPPLRTRTPNRALKTLDKNANHFHSDAMVCCSSFFRRPARQKGPTGI